MTVEVYYLIILQDQSKKVGWLIKTLIKKLSLC